jgi:hypothetical protein
LGALEEPGHIMNSQASFPLRTAILSFTLLGCGLGGVGSLGDDEAELTVGGEAGTTSEPERGGAGGDGGAEGSAGDSSSSAAGGVMLTTEPVPVPGSEFSIVGSQLAFVNEPSLLELSVRTSQLTVSVETVEHSFDWPTLETDSLVTYPCMGGNPSLALGSCPDDASSECLQVTLGSTGILSGSYRDAEGARHVVLGTLRGVFGPVEGRQEPAEGVLYAELELWDVNFRIQLSGLLVVMVPVTALLC